MKIAVIGAGISGLGAAYLLSRKHEVDVYEKEARLGGLFFQKKNLFSLAHYKMIYDIFAFNKKANYDVEENTKELNKSLGEYLENFGETFKERYILPMGAAIWSTPSDRMDEFLARTFLQFFKNHGLLGVNTQHQWLTVSNGFINYVEKIQKFISGKINLQSDVMKVKRDKNNVYLYHKDGRISTYDKVIFALHAPDALALLEDPSQEEEDILSLFAYKNNDALYNSAENFQLSL